MLWMWLPLHNLMCRCDVMQHNARPCHILKQAHLAQQQYCFTAHFSSLLEIPYEFCHRGFVLEKVFHHHLKVGVACYHTGHTFQHLPCLPLSLSLRPEPRSSAGRQLSCQSQGISNNQKKMSILKQVKFGSIK